MYKLKQLKDNFLQFLSENKKAILKPIVFILACFAVFAIYDFFFGYYITVRFSELGAMSKSMPVYYKGYNLGKTKNIKPDKNFTHTLVKVRFFDRDINLPQNIKAKVKTLSSGDYYIEILYPDDPAIQKLRKGDIIDGEITLDLQTFISSQIEAGAMNKLTENATTTLESIEKTSDELKGLIADFREVLKENKNNIKEITTNTADTTENLASMTGYLSDLSLNINKSIKPDKVEKMVLNLTDTTDNIKKSTTSLDTAITRVNIIACEFQQAAKNINKITGGFLELLKTRFAGLKIFFGKPLKECYPDSRCAKCP